MREIKFRAWVHNYMDYDPVIYGSHELGECWVNGAIKSSVDRGQIFMQFTGLLDKNGREIYEGDILQSSNEPGDPIQHVVEWSDRFCGWFAKNLTDKSKDKRDGSVQLWVYVGSVEHHVIGNKWENPELLK